METLQMAASVSQQQRSLPKKVPMAMRSMRLLLALKQRHCVRRCRC
jgi:hypothetical protein